MTATERYRRKLARFKARRVRHPSPSVESVQTAPQIAPHLGAPGSKDAKPHKRRRRVIREPFPVVMDGVTCYALPLTQGEHAIIDAVDLPLASTRTWCLLRCQGGQKYARSGARGTTATLHIFLFGKRERWVLDHKNGNGLDCRRDNMRFCTTAQNIQNSARRPRNGFRGVHVDGKRDGFLASIQANNQTYRLGIFNSREEAARAYDAAAQKLHGEFARLNFPPEAPQTPIQIAVEVTV